MLSAAQLDLSNLGIPGWLIFILTIIGALITLISWAYYIHWSVEFTKRKLPSLISWIKQYIRKKDRPTAEHDARTALQIRLTTKILDTSTVLISILRIILLAVIIYQFVSSEPTLPKSWGIQSQHQSTLLYGVLAILAGYYSISILAWGRLSYKKVKEVDQIAANSTGSTKGIASSYRLPDIFFLPAISDALFLTLVGMFIPDEVDIHLGFFIPVCAGWLFSGPRRIIIILLIVAISLQIQSVWKAFMFEGKSDLIHEIGNFSDTAGKILFWSVISSFMILMRAVRRNEEEQALFFRALAEALPFEVFVKDSNLRFLFANERMLGRLFSVRGHSDRKTDGLLTLAEIQSLRDVDLGVEKEKAEFYAKIDQEIIDEKRPKYHDFEKSYEPGSTEKIETIKVPILGWNGKPQYVLGLCSDPDEDKDDWFFRSIVASHQDYCFFVKLNGKIRWANATYLNWTGHAQIEDVVDKGDSDLFEEPFSLSFLTDDEFVLQHGSLEREEWNKAKLGRLRRVCVCKRRITNSDGIPVGVRGFFFDVHSRFMRRNAIEIILSKYLFAFEDSKEAGYSGGRRGSAQLIRAMFLYCCRILNLGKEELNSVRERKLDGLHGEIPELCLKVLSIDKPDRDVITIIDYVGHLFPTVRFEFRGWEGAKPAMVDIRALNAVIFALCVNAGERLTRTLKLQSNIQKAYLSMSFAKFDSRECVCISVTDNAPNSEFDLITLDECSQWVDHITGEMFVGLQIVKAVSSIIDTTALLHRKPPTDIEDTPFRFYYPC